MAIHAINGSYKTTSTRFGSGPAAAKSAAQSADPWEALIQDFFNNSQKPAAPDEKPQGFFGKLMTNFKRLLLLGAALLGYKWISGMQWFQPIKKHIDKWLGFLPGI